MHVGGEEMHLVAWAVNTRALGVCGGLCIVQRLRCKLVHHGLPNAWGTMDGEHQRLAGVGIADVVADSITQLPQRQALPNDLRL